MMDGRCAFIPWRSTTSTVAGENSIGNLQPSGEPAQPRPDGWWERYLKTYLMEMIRCMKEGVPIEGYLYWTLVDDVQPPRLGLCNYDFVNHRILDTDGFGQPSGEIYGHLVAAFGAATRRRSPTPSCRLSGRVGLRYDSEPTVAGTEQPAHHLRLGFRYGTMWDGGGPDRRR